MKFPRITPYSAPRVASWYQVRSMTTVPKRTEHDERTSTEPRSSNLHTVTLSKVVEVNRNIRTFQFTAPGPIEVCSSGGVICHSYYGLTETRSQFLPGQWLDVHLPGLPKPGGFTITSPPSSAEAQPALIELAVQKSSVNPAAVWLWQEQSQIIKKSLQVRVGGSFVWPPTCPPEKVQHVLLVAGGVGINPLISIVKNFMATKTWPARVTFLYGSKVTRNENGIEDVLYLKDLLAAEKAASGKMKLKLFLTGEVDECFPHFGPFERRRMGEADLAEAIGGDGAQTVCYVCGIPSMTDNVVQFLTSKEGMSEDRVLCERWW